MSEGTRVYSIAGVSFSWGGVNLMAGIAEGGEITVTDKVEDKWTQEDIGVAGAAAVQTFNPSRSGMVEMPIARASDLYQKLIAIIEADEKTRNQVATGTIKDASSGEKEVLQGMRLANRPPRVKSSGANGSAVFRWIYTRSDITTTDGDDNLVGAGITAADPLGSEE